MLSKHVVIEFNGSHDFMSGVKLKHNIMRLMTAAYAPHDLMRMLGQAIEDYNPSSDPTWH